MANNPVQYNINQPSTQPNIIQPNMAYPMHMGYPMMQHPNMHPTMIQQHNIQQPIMAQPMQQPLNMTMSASPSINYEEHTKEILQQGMGEDQDEINNLKKEIQDLKDIIREKKKDTDDIVEKKKFPASSLINKKKAPLYIIFILMYILVTLTSLSLLTGKIIKYDSYGNYTFMYRFALFSFIIFIGMSGYIIYSMIKGIKKR
jgi:hypothetical protein